MICQVSSKFEGGDIKQTDRRTNILILLLYRLGLRPSVGPLGLRPSVGPLRGSRPYRWKSLNQLSYGFILPRSSSRILVSLDISAIEKGYFGADLHHFLV